MSTYEVCVRFSDDLARSHISMGSTVKCPSDEDHLLAFVCHATRALQSTARSEAGLRLATSLRWTQVDALADVPRSDVWKKAMDDSCQNAKKRVEVRVTMATADSLPLIIVKSHGFGFLCRGVDVACARSADVHLLYLGFLYADDLKYLEKVTQATAMLAGFHERRAISMATERKISRAVTTAAMQGAWIITV
jgi:hypothetical protein